MSISALCFPRTRSVPRSWPGSPSTITQLRFLPAATMAARTCDRDGVSPRVLTGRFWKFATGSDAAAAKIPVEASHKAARASSRAGMVILPARKDKAPSVRLQSRLADDVAPLADLGLNVGGELLRGAGQRIGADAGEA